MRKITITALTLTLAALGFAGGSRAFDGAATAPVTTATMQEKIDALGYDVQRLRTTDRGFKARIIDRDSGGVVQVRFDAAGDLTAARLAH